ncbi:MAG: hypothetical protein JKY37_02930 [Nannocystaceae bacterium]|nr:hypothetical protein [Nannocystaceae bacterium]
MVLAAGLLGGTALAISVGRAAWFYGRCDSFHYDDGCFGAYYPVVTTLVFGGPQFAATATGLGLALAGSRRRAIHDGPSSWTSRKRNVMRGSALLAVGIAIRVVSSVLVIRASTVDSDAVYDDEVDGETMRRFYTAGVVSGQIGDTLATVGGGLLTYAIASKRGTTATVAVSAGGLQVRF